MPGVTKRLVDYFFADKDSNKKQEIVDRIVSSNPERWEDIFKQIIFSKEYLLQEQESSKCGGVGLFIDKKNLFRAGTTRLFVILKRLISSL